MELFLAILLVLPLYFGLVRKKNSLSHLMFMLYTCLDGQLSACLLSDGL